MSSFSDPSRDYVAITPSDSTNIRTNMLTRGIYVGTSGALVAVRDGGETVSFVGVAGTVIPIRCVRVNSTGTAASNLVALF